MTMVKQIILLISLELTLQAGLLRAEPLSNECAAAANTFAIEKMMAPTIGKLIKEEHDILIAVAKVGTHELRSGKKSAKAQTTACKPSAAAVQAVDLLTELEQVFFSDYVSGTDASGKGAALVKVREFSSRLTELLSSAAPTAAEHAAALHQILGGENPVSRSVEVSELIEKILNGNFGNCPPVTSVYRYSSDPEVELIGDAAEIVATGLNVQGLQLQSITHGKADTKIYVSFASPSESSSIREAVDCNNDGFPEVGVSASQPFPLQEGKNYFIVARPGVSTSEQTNLNPYLQKLISDKVLQPGKNWFQILFVAGIAEPQAAAAYTDPTKAEFTVPNEFARDLTKLIQERSWQSPGNGKTPAVSSNEAKIIYSWLTKKEDDGQPAKPSPAFPSGAIKLLKKKGQYYQIRLTLTAENADQLKGVSASARCRKDEFTCKLKLTPGSAPAVFTGRLKIPVRDDGRTKVYSLTAAGQSLEGAVVPFFFGNVKVLGKSGKIVRAGK